MFSYGRITKKTGKEKEPLLLKAQDVGIAAGIGRARSTPLTQELGLHSLPSPAPRINFRSSQVPALTEHQPYSTAVALSIMSSRNKAMASPASPPALDWYGGPPVYSRSSDERAINPDRLNLDRRKLTVCPRLEGEEQLRLLNFQHNFITKMENFMNLKRLIFLDLYDNQVSRIEGLEVLPSLRVLMLGKNRITKIDNLECVVRLDVLDLHGNQITQIENLNHLKELRVLNLAGNLLTVAENFKGLESLTELNLRRNAIGKVKDVHTMPSLQRLFLSFNEIQSFDDVSSTMNCPNLVEVAFDGNPVSQEASYKRTMLKYLRHLQQLDGKRVMEEEKRLAFATAQKEEEKQYEMNKLQEMRERKQRAISNVKRQWQYLQGSGRTNILMPEIIATHVSNVPNEQTLAQSTSGRSTPSSSQALSQHESRPGSQPYSRPASAKSQLLDRLLPRPPSNGPLAEKTKSSISNSLSEDSVTELEGGTLTLYGNKALEAFDKNWGIQATAAVTAIILQFVEFDEALKHLYKIRVRFPNVHSLHFHATNICSLKQLNGLSVVRRLDDLSISEEGNPITKFLLWKQYLLFRLAHFSLKTINNAELTASDIVNAEKMFGPLAQCITAELPTYRIMTLYNEGKKRQLLTEDKKKPLLTDGKLTEKGAESLGRAGLVYNTDNSAPQSASSSSDKSRQEFAQSYIQELSHLTLLNYSKKMALQQLWPQILSELVSNAVRDLCMDDVRAQAKKCLQELEKSL